MRRVHIHYLRPPDREEVFHQDLIHEEDGVLVTWARNLTFDPPVRVGERTVLETGSDVVWFTWPGRWHDVGRFHTADGTFQGLYANVITPPEIEGSVWHTTDLFLDVWLPADGAPPRVLDRHELDEAVEEGWVDGDTAARALEEVDRLLEAHQAGSWPPPEVHAWTLDVVRRRCG